MTDYEEEDFNLKLYETQRRTITENIYNIILSRLQKYNNQEIPIYEKNELLLRLALIFKQNLNIHEH